MNFKSRVSVSEFLTKSRSRRLWSQLLHCYLVLPMQRQKHNEIDLSNISFCIKELAKFHYLEWCYNIWNYTKWHQFFDGVARNLLYTQACKITPSGNTVRQHQCRKQSRAWWPDCARCVLPNIHEILPNYKNFITINIAEILTNICKNFFVQPFTLTINPIII